MLWKFLGFTLLTTSVYTSHTAVLITAITLYITSLVLISLITESFYLLKHLLPVPPLPPNLSKEADPSYSCFHFMGKTHDWDSWRWNDSSKTPSLVSVDPGLWVNLLVQQRFPSWLLFQDRRVFCGTPWWLPHSWTCHLTLQHVRALLADSVSSHLSTSIPLKLFEGKSQAIKPFQ